MKGKHLMFALSSLVFVSGLAGFAQASAPCDVGCKIRVHACDAKQPARCFFDDLHPERTGLCAFMMMGVVAEWQGKHPDALFKSAECVRPDDNQI